MEKPIEGKIKAEGVESEFSKVTADRISKKYDYMDPEAQGFWSVLQG